MFVCEFLDGMHDAHISWGGHFVLIKFGIEIGKLPVRNAMEMQSMSVSVIFQLDSFVCKTDVTHYDKDEIGYPPLTTVVYLNFIEIRPKAQAPRHEIFIRFSIKQSIAAQRPCHS